MPGEKGQYGYVRRAEEKQKKPRKKKNKNQEPSYPDDDFIVGNDFIVGSSKLEGMGVFAGSVPIQGLGEMNMQVGGGAQELSGMIQMYESTPGAGPSMVNQGPAEEEMDEEAEWAVRVGHSPPPLWGGGAEKRKASQEADYAIGTKRPRPKYVLFPAVELQPTDPVAK